MGSSINLGIGRRGRRGAGGAGRARAGLRCVVNYFAIERKTSLKCVLSGLVDVPTTDQVSAVRETATFRIQNHEKVIL